MSARDAAILGRNFINSLVSMLRCIPSVELVSFLLLPKDIINTARWLRQEDGMIGKGMQYSEMSSWIFCEPSQPFHLTNPPNIDLQALPDPILAIIATYFWLNKLGNILSRQDANADRPLAELAMPEAVGNVFSDVILKWFLEQSLSRSLTILNIFFILPVSSLLSPFKISKSSSYCSDHYSFVMVARSAELRVRLSESLYGRMSYSLDLPQYLTRAMFGEDRHKTTRPSDYILLNINFVSECLRQFGSS